MYIVYGYHTRRVNALCTYFRHVVRVYIILFTGVFLLIFFYSPAEFSVFNGLNEFTSCFCTVLPALSRAKARNYHNSHVNRVCVICIRVERCECCCI